MLEVYQGVVMNHMPRIVLFLALAGIVVAAQAAMTSMSIEGVGVKGVTANLFGYSAFSADKEDIMNMYLHSETGGKNTLWTPAISTSKWAFSPGEAFGGSEIVIFRGGNYESDDDKEIEEGGWEAFNLKITEFNHYDPKKPPKPPKPPKNKSIESNWVGFNPEP